MADPRTLTVPGQFEQLAPISDFITQVARDAGFDEDDVFYIQMAVDEACANIVEHSYGPNDRGEITLKCSSDPDGALRVEIRDTGRSFNPDQIPPPRIDNEKGDVDEVQIGGLGLYFIRKLMDEVTFHFDPFSGNRLTLIKRRRK